MDKSQENYIKCLQHIFYELLVFAAVMKYNFFFSEYDGPERLDKMQYKKIYIENQTTQTLWSRLGGLSLNLSDSTFIRWFQNIVFQL